MIPCGLYTSSKFKNELLSLRIREKLQEQNLTQRKSSNDLATLPDIIVNRPMKVSQSVTSIQRSDYEKSPQKTIYTPPQFTNVNSPSKADLEKKPQLEQNLKKVLK